MLVKRFHPIASAALAALLLGAPVAAQGQPAPGPGAQPQGRGRGPQTPAPVSPEVHADRRVTFRVTAPQAQNVRLVSPDVPNASQLPPFSKGEGGVWETTVGPLDPGPYRYTFNVDGLVTVDSRNPTTSEANATVFSLLYVPGSDTMDLRQVPHGIVAPVTYYSTTLGRHRRMHVYTPPGYQTGRDRYPVFYLLHGSSDSDHSWSSVGRAGIILDNLIASKQAAPMIVVMPAGHTTGPTQGGAGPSAASDFVQDFVTDLMPHVERNFRVLTDRRNRAIAGLSMGGGQTLNIAMANLDRFAYIGVFSSSLAGGRGGGAGATEPPFGAAWEAQHRAALENASLKRGLRLFWLGTGTNDGVIERTRSSAELLRRHGFDVELVETPGAGHTWRLWRDYLTTLAPRLFK